VPVSATRGVSLVRCQITARPQPERKETNWRVGVWRGRSRIADIDFFAPVALV